MDGRDPNAKGYIKENRPANEKETRKVEEALESFGVPQTDIDGMGIHLFGRMDDVYGWFLFGLTNEVSGQPSYLILGDCLDVLDEPYNKVLNLEEVVQYLRTTEKGLKGETGYEAAQEWGVFSSLSKKFCEVFEELEVAVENETFYWDSVRKEWKVKWEVNFTTESGADELTTIAIPACLDTQEDADRAFADEWYAYADGFCMENEIANCELGLKEFSRADAEIWAESKLDAIKEIKRHIVRYLEDGVFPDDDKDKVVSNVKGATIDKRDPVSIWVLTTVDGIGEITNSIHESEDAAIQEVADWFTDRGFDRFDDETRGELKEEHYLHDDICDVRFQIDECFNIAIDRKMAEKYC